MRPAFSVGHAANIGSHAGLAPFSISRLSDFDRNAMASRVAGQRIKGVAPDIPLSKRFWPLTADKRQVVESLMTQEDIQRLVTSLRGCKADAGARVLDAAFWRKGCSSLGRLRVAVLVAVGTGHAERHSLTDMEEATIAVAPGIAGRSMTRDDAERVVTGTCNMSPFLEVRMATHENAPPDLRRLLRLLAVLNLKRAVPKHRQVLGREMAQCP